MIASDEHRDLIRPGVPTLPAASTLALTGKSYQSQATPTARYYAAPHTIEGIIPSNQPTVKQ
jgi:hypothetical protein